MSAFPVSLNIWVGSLHIAGVGRDRLQPTPFILAKQGLAGWDESTNGRDNGGDRPTEHGKYDVPLLRSGRAITVTGTILADSQQKLEALRDKITALGADGQAVRFMVEKPGEHRYANVRVVSAKTIDIDPTTASFVLQLVAADPRRYGDTRQYGPDTTVGARHFGTTQAIPTIYIKGSMPAGYRILGPGGREFRVRQPLVSGQLHEIRMRTGWLYRDGVLQAGAVTRAQLWTIPPGKGFTDTTIVPNSGTGQIEVRVRDTFM